MLRRKLVRKKSMGNLKAHFDQANLDETLHPKTKDYGHMAISETRTPWPRNEPAVDAQLLRTRIAESLAKMDLTWSIASVNTIEPLESLTPESIAQQASERESFYLKRQKFYRAEYALAKQRNMSDETHPPGQSHGSKMSHKFSNAILK